MDWLRVIIPADFLIHTFVSSSPTWPPTEAPLRLWLARAVRLVLWGLLVAGLVLGLAWATLHFWIVPRIAEFRPALENLARQSLGVPVRIGSLSAQSTGWVPAFELRDIALQDAQGRTALHLPQVKVALGLRSIWLGQLDQLVLDAPELTLRLSADGQWQIAGMDWRPTAGADSPAADWLLRQREVVVRGARVHWHGPSQHPDTPSDPGSPQPLTLHDVDLVMRNSARQHALRLDATPPEGWGERFVLMGQFKRGLLSLHPGRLADWSGQIFANFPQLDMAPWSAQGLQWPTKLSDEAGRLQGQGRLNLWADVHQGQWRGGLADVDLKNLQVRLTPDQSALILHRVSGRLGLQVHAEGFLAETHDLRVEGQDGLSWPGGHLSLDYTHAQGTRPAKGQLQATQVDLPSLQALALRIPVSAGLPPRLRTALQARDVLGQITALDLHWQGDWRQPEIQEARATVEGLSWQPGSAAVAAWGTLPGADVPGLRGGQLTLVLNANGGRLDVQTGAGSALWLPGLLQPSEVPLQHMQASVRWARQAGEHPDKPWHVPHWSLSLANADLQGQWQGQWQPAPSGRGPGILSLKGRVQRAQAAAVHRYLPLNLPPEVRHYLRDALVQGRYENVQVHIQGDLDKMPFAQPEDGTFFFSGQLKDGEFDMVPTSLMHPGDVPWPRLRGLQGRLTFDRLGMQLREASARVGVEAQAIELKAASVNIADMAHQPVLRVQAQSLADAPLVLGVVRQSPLNALLSGALQSAQASGPLTTRFALQLPLLDLSGARVQGSVQFNGNDLRMAPGTPWLNKLVGTLQFHERGFDVRQLQATLLGGPTLIDGGMHTPQPVAGQTAQQPPQTVFEARGRLSAAGLQAAQDVAPLNLLAQHARGATDYQARLAWPKGLPELTVRSQLGGLGLQLPAPLGKPANLETPLALNIRTQQTASGLQDNISLTLGDRVHLVYERDVSTDTPRVLRGRVGLGVLADQMPALPISGVTANMAMDRLVVDEWLELLPTNTDSNAPTTTSQTTLASATGSAPPASSWQGYLPTRLGLKANTLIAKDRHLRQVQAGGTYEAGRWRGNIDATELSGHLVFEPAIPGQTDQAGQLFARLSRLNLQPSSEREVESLLEAPPTSLPALDIVVDSLVLRGKPLGRVEIEAVNADKGLNQTPAAREWQLKKFNIDLPEGTLRSTGRWLAAREGSPWRKTEMNFVLDVRDAGALLTRLGTPDALRGGTGQLEGVVSWQGSPLNLHYPSLNGHLEVRMGRGQFLKADPGVAKLLGVLSLQALPRRLLLDFRDVFAQGFAFDSVQGDVTIVHGMANTRNLQIKGVNALVQMDGSADLARETQKLRVHILPIVDTGTASLVAAITVNPLVGLSTFIAQWLLQNPLARASAQEFLVDGSWANPQVTRVDSRPAQPTAPINPP